MGLVDTQDIKDEDGNVFGFQAIVDDLDYKVEYVEEDGDIYLIGWEELEDDIKYQRRRLNKAWRIFRSETPTRNLNVTTTRINCLHGVGAAYPPN